MPLSKKQVVISGFAPNFDLKLQTLLAGDDLHQLFTVKVQRRVSLLQITPDTLLEMAEDTGEIEAENQKEPIAEVELEIKEGKKAELFAFVTKLAAKVPLFIEPNSKFARGLHLLSQGPGTLWMKEKAPSLVGKAGTETEIKKLFNYYLSNILAKQNMLRGRNLPAIADKLLFADWWNLTVLWHFALPLLPENIYRQYAEQLRIMLQPWEELAVLRRAGKNWRKIMVASGGLLDKEQLSHQLLERQKQVMTQLKAIVRTGQYTLLAFSLLNYLQESTWQKADYLLLEQFVGYRNKALERELTELDRLPETAATARQVQEKIYGLVFWLKRLKFKGETKKEITAWEQLAKQLRILNYGVYGAPYVLALQRGKAGRQLSREVGILCGYRLRGAAKGWKQLKKCWNKLPKSLLPLATKKSV